MIEILNESIKSYDLNSLYSYVEEKYNVTILSWIKEYLNVNKQLKRCRTYILYKTI